MSCNGCRVLRKGCNENCILKQSISGIETAQAQASATVFVAKFFGRAGLLSFLSSVPEHQRPALFQSLLFEACGRTVNPINGAVGLLWTGNWHVCQSAVATILRGGSIQAMPELFSIEATQVMTGNNNASEIGVTRSEGGENSDPWMENVSETTTSESGTRSGSTCTEAKLLTLFL
ncbi:LOB domain-containing protein 37-like protein [Tanacetum coccineum]